MIKIPEQCVYAVGPYKGYCGRALYNPETGIFHGEVVGVRDVVTFQGTTPAELRSAFSESVDDYLDFCAARNERPEKPFSGKLLTRMDPDLHQKISVMAELNGVSLNQFICDSLGKAVGETLLHGKTDRASRGSGRETKKVKPPRGQAPRRDRNVKVSARRTKMRTK